VKVSQNCLFPSKSQVFWLHLQVVFVHLWGGSFTHSVTPRKLHPYKP